MSARSQISLIIWSIAFLLIFAGSCFFIMGVLPPPSAQLPDDQVAKFFTEHSAALRIGGAIALGTAAFNIPFAAVITYQMLRLKRGLTPWAIVHAMGGAMMTMWLALPVLFWAVAAFTPERAAGVTRLMSDLSWLTFVTTISHYIFQAVAVAYVCLTHRVDSPYFPRWLGYLSIWTLFVTEVGVAGFLTKTGPFAWNGLFVFWFPVAIFFVWAFSLAYIFITNLLREAREADAKDALDASTTAQ
jgi:hypothetical protein